MALRLQILHPRGMRGTSGNAITVERWAERIRRLGLRVDADSDLIDGTDGLLVLHVERCANGALEFRRKQPNAPLIAAISGTDLYREGGLSNNARRVLDTAERVVALQPETVRDLPPELRTKARVIRQSAAPAARLAPNPERFELLLLAHLRPVKRTDFAARAAELLPTGSRVQILHAGEALDDISEREARRSNDQNPRYTWLGSKTHAQSLELLARSRALLNTSLSEGGSAALTEALAVGVPVLATRIPGNVGVLGPSYPGLIERDAPAELAQRMRQLESEPEFGERIQLATDALREQNGAERELNEWKGLLTEVGLIGP